jgi:hypothetical protein
MSLTTKTKTQGIAALNATHLRELRSMQVTRMLELPLRNRELVCLLL